MSSAAGIGLDELASRCGMTEVPGSWEKHWPGFTSWLATSGCSRLKWRLSADAAEVFDLPPACLPSLTEALAAISTDDHFRLLAEFWHYLVYHLPGEIGDDSNRWPTPETLAGVSSRLFTLAVIVSGTDHAQENLRASKVREEIVLATLSYIGRYVRDVRQKRGVFGLESMTWLRNYVRADVFRLGRLTFRNSEYRWPFRAFQHRAGGQVVTLCEPTLRYRLDGLADGTNGKLDPQKWTPVLELDEREIRGCRVDEERCAAVREPVRLSTAEWACVLAPGDRRVEVHIAGGSRMPPDECADAYRQAMDFFPQRYPGIRWAAFTCASWLLDPGLRKMLPAASNIVQFQRAYHLLPVLGNSDQVYDLVYGSPSADPLKMPRDTQLRRAICEYVSGGSEMRSVAGYVLWHEADRAWG